MRDDLDYIDDLEELCRVLRRAHTRHLDEFQKRDDEIAKLTSQLERVTEAYQRAVAGLQAHVDAK